MILLLAFNKYRVLPGPDVYKVIKTTNRQIHTKNTGRFSNILPLTVAIHTAIFLSYCKAYNFEYNHLLFLYSLEDYSF